MRRAVIFCIAAFAFIACAKEEEQPTNTDQPVSSSDHTMLIANEGPFGAGSGTLSLVNLTSGAVDNDLFLEQNGFPLGNIVQSNQRYQDKIYTVVNNAQKVEVSGFPTMDHIATIDGLGQPRYMHIYGSHGYVSDWSTNGVHVVNLQSHSIEATVMTGNGPEAMLQHDMTLYVVNSGGFANDHRVTLVDMTDLEAVEQIEVSDNPIAIVADQEGKLRVLCRGISDWQDPSNDTSGALVTLDPLSGEVEETINFPSPSDHPTNLVANSTGEFLFFLLDGNIYRMSASDSVLPTAPLVSGNFYSLGFHDEASALVATDAQDYQSNGNIHVFDVEGNAQAVFEVGVIPTHILPL